MSIRGQRVDMAGPDIHRKRAHSLDRIHQINASVTMANLTNLLNGRPVTAQELHEADSEQPGARQASSIRSSESVTESQVTATPFDSNRFQGK